MGKKEKSNKTIALKHQIIYLKRETPEDCK